jgi:hypothetical protein
MFMELFFKKHAILGEIVVIYKMLFLNVFLIVGFSNLKDVLFLVLAYSQQKELLYSINNELSYLN